MFPDDFIERDLNPPDDGELILDRCSNETCERPFRRDLSDAEDFSHYCSKACEDEAREAEE